MENLKEENKILKNCINEIIETIKYASDTSCPTHYEIIDIILNTGLFEVDM